MVHLDYRDARPIYCQIVDGLREQIRAGVLASGDKLPSVRELAAELTINPNTIQRAYRELEVEGWIATVPGKGCFVCADPGLDSKQETALWEELNRAYAGLLALGYNAEAVVRKMEKGGNDHA